MAFRNDHEAALRRAQALQADLEAEKRTEAEKDAKIAALEHELGDAKAALAHAGIAAPATTTRTWAEVSAQLDDYLEQSRIAGTRGAFMVACFPASIVSWAFALVISSSGGQPVFWPATLVAAVVCLTVVMLGRRYRPGPITPLVCATCKLAIVGKAESDAIKLVRSLHRCPHCQSPLSVD